MQIIISSPAVAFWLICALVFILGGCLVFIGPFVRYITKKVAADILSVMLTDKYTQNIAELLPSLKRFSVLNAIELSLRAETGKVITRPLGTPKHFLSFENIMFAPRQMKALPLPVSAPVDMRVCIGPKAEKPLFINTPLMISGMAYGLALSEEAKMGLVYAANQLKTAVCSGEGPVLPEEYKIAEKYVLQICHWPWGARTTEQIQSASMLEVQIGKGADIGSGRRDAAVLAGRARKIGGLAPDEAAISLTAPPGIQSPEDWPAYMSKLRQKANGIPIALKLMATGNLEEDLAKAVELGFDAVVIDGAQAGSHASAPIKQDDFGIPTLEALVRARRFLTDRQISLIISGGFFTPGQCLKALALGADAVYLGTVPLFALAHGQTNKVMPWEPLTTLVYYDSSLKGKLDVKKAAASVKNIFQSMTLEMEEALRALGKNSLEQLGRDDLIALDDVTALLTELQCGSPPRSTAN